MRSFRLLAGLALLLVPVVAQSQRRSSYERDHCCREQPRRALSLVVGVLDHDFEANKTFPMAALRGEWRVSRHVRSELGASYALGETYGTGTSGEDGYTSLVSATVGIQAELPVPFIKPYIGAAAGLFGRFDEDGTRSWRPTHAFPLGVRVPLSERIGLRGEVRFRLDEHDGAATAENFEKTVGISVAF